MTPGQSPEVKVFQTRNQAFISSYVEKHEAEVVLLRHAPWLETMLLGVQPQEASWLLGLQEIPEEWSLQVSE
jgi:hypothetical protein